MQTRAQHWSQRLTHALTDDVDSRGLALCVRADAQTQRSKVSGEHKSNRRAKNDESAENLRISLRQRRDHHGKSRRYCADIQQSFWRSRQNAQGESLNDHHCKRRRHERRTSPGDRVLG